MGVWATPNVRAVVSPRPRLPGSRPPARSGLERWLETPRIGEGLVFRAVDRYRRVASAVPVSSRTSRPRRAPGYPVQPHSLGVRRTSGALVPLLLQGLCRPSPKGLRWLFADSQGHHRNGNESPRRDCDDNYSAVGN